MDMIETIDFIKAVEAHGLGFIGGSPGILYKYGLDSYSTVIWLCVNEGRTMCKAADIDTLDYGYYGIYSGECDHVIDDLDSLEIYLYRLDARVRILKKEHRLRAIEEL